MLTFFVTSIGFTSFSFAPNSPHFRCQLTSLLLLTLVNFRWILSNSIPSISYLTLLDKYSIGSIIFLFALFIWHTVLAAYDHIIFYENFHYNNVTPSASVISEFSLKAKLYDKYFFYGFIFSYFVFNLTFLLVFLKILRSIKLIEKRSQNNDMTKNHLESQ